MPGSSFPPARARLFAAVATTALLCLGVSPATAATTSLTMTVDPATPSAAATVRLESTIAGSPLPALQVLGIAMPTGFAYRGDQIATVCRAEDLNGYEPRCAESSLLGTGTAVAQFKRGTVTGSVRVDPVRMYNAGPDAVLFHMRALPPVQRGVVVPSTVKLTDPDFGPVFQVGPAVGANLGTVALTAFSFTSRPGVFTTGPCETGTWVAGGRYLFLGGATQELNPRIACAAPGEPTGPSTGSASDASPGAALTIAGTTVAEALRARGLARVRVVSTSLRTRNGRVAIRLQCRSAARCLGTVRLDDRRPAGGIARYGTVRFSAAGKTSKTVAVKLRRQWRAALTRGRGVAWVRAHLDGAPRQRDSVRRLKLRR